mgnify:CR=1 FL=1
MSKSNVVRKHIETENKHDMEAMLATLVGEDPIRDEAYGKLYRGREEVASRYAELWEAFPDFNVTPTQFIEDETSVAMTADYSGTSKGKYNERAPTGKTFKVRLVVIFQFEGNKIKSETIYFDLASQLTQLGFM